VPSGTSKKLLPVFVFRCLAALAFAWLYGCATPTPQDRLAAALSLAAQADWKTTRIEAGRFQLLALHPKPQNFPVLAIFIEGDGLAWLDAFTPSADPTPVDPLALRLALIEPHLPSAYLARPCQFNPAPEHQQCRVDDWTQARFSPEIISAMNQGLSNLKQLFGAQRLVLIGYSGGGAIAALLAARRDDVNLLVTVAAVLDHAVWTRQHQISPLLGSLNPADDWSALQNIRQIHLTGEQDQLTGISAIQPYIERFSKSKRPTVKQVPLFTHACCWTKDWTRLSPL